MDAACWRYEVTVVVDNDMTALLAAVDQVLGQIDSEGYVINSRKLSDAALALRAMVGTERSAGVVQSAEATAGGTPAQANADGLVALPPIRVSEGAHALMSRIAEVRGMTLQDVVRDALEPGEVMGGGQGSRAGGAVPMSDGAPATGSRLQAAHGLAAAVGAVGAGDPMKALLGRLRSVAEGVRVYGAPDRGLLASRIERLCDEVEGAAATAAPSRLVDAQRAEALRGLLEAATRANQLMLKEAGVGVVDLRAIKQAEAALRG